MNLSDMQRHYTAHRTQILLYDNALRYACITHAQMKRDLGDIPAVLVDVRLTLATLYHMGLRTMPAEVALEFTKLRLDQ